MGQPVKLSDELVLNARMMSDLTDRSIAGQIEYWAQLGRAVEPLLDGARVIALRRSLQERKLSDCLTDVDSPSGRARVAAHLNSLPYPRYEPAPDAPGLLVRIEASGARTLGRFVGREFRAAE
jgi:hypothetical protein